MPLKNIKCPNCGSGKVIHVMDGVYVCTYCEQKFERVKEETKKDMAAQKNPVVPESKGCPICGKDNSKEADTYLCKICHRSNICKDHIYFQESDNFFACSECMKCSICGKNIDISFYKREDLEAYCPECDITIGVECFKFIENPELEGELFYYCPKCGNFMCNYDTYGDEVRSQMIKDMTFKCSYDPDFLFITNYFEQDDKYKKSTR